MDDAAAAVQLSHVPVLSGGSSRLSGCRRRRHWQYRHPPARLLVDVQGTIERSGPRKTPDPATTTSTHHHRQLIVTRPAPNGLLRSEKETKTPYGPLSPPDSASPTNSVSPGVCCWPCPALGLQSGLFLRVSLSGRGPISEAVALGSFPVFLPSIFYRFFSISFKRSTSLLDRRINCWHLLPHPPRVPPHHLIWTSRFSKT